MKDSLIIVSGGMDSVTLLYEKKENIALAVSFDYGSNHNQKEIPFAKLHCERLGIKHIVIPLGFIHNYFKSSLLEGAEAIPEGNYDDENMKSTVVPFRNGIMLSIACGIAESNGLKKVLIANHFGDHAIYPDCRKGFINAMSEAMKNGTYESITIDAPYTNITKTDVARHGKELGIDYAETWSCYKGGEKHCRFYRIRVMAQKQQGNTRAVTPTTKAIRASGIKYNRLLESGNYDKNLSFYNSSTGGYLLYAKGRKMDNMEYNAATYLAIKGYQVKMTPEGSGKYALAIVNGKSRYGDGFISLTSYEQRSSTPINDATARKTVENAINHARKKGANIAVLFDYNRAFKLSDITHGTKHYEDAYRNAKHSSVKTLIVVSGRGNVHEWELFK